MTDARFAIERAFRIVRREGVFNMDLLRWVAEGTNIVGLMIYSAGMILIAGALALANYADHRQDKQEQSANR